jgi:hypothetical protein
MDVQAHAFDGMNLAVLRGEAHIQIADFQQRRHQ